MCCGWQRPKKLDETMSKLHLPARGAALNVTWEQADYTGVKLEGPFNCGHYRFRAARLSGCCRVEIESELCDAHVFHFVSLSPSLLRWICAVRGFIASAAPAFGVVCSHSSMLVSGQWPGLYGQWSAPTAQMEPLYRSGQQEVHQHYWPEERGVADRLCDLEFGTYFLAGWFSLESSRRRSRPAVPLAVPSEKCHQQHPTARDLRGQARQAAMRGRGP